MFALPPLRRLVVLSLIALSAALVAPMGATATGTSVFPPDSHPLGKTLRRVVRAVVAAGLRHGRHARRRRSRTAR